MVALEKQSTTTNMESYPLEGGRSVTKSIVMISQMPDGTLLGCNGIWVLGWIFVVWQVGHPSTYWWMKWNIPGHQNSLEMSSNVFQCPGCPVAMWS
jgi:hypothetical protein